MTDRFPGGIDRFELSDELGRLERESRFAEWTMNFFDEGPHLDYAGQWFIFATLTVIVYPLLLRRTARHKASEKAEAAHDAEMVG